MKGGGYDRKTSNQSSNDRLLLEWINYLVVFGLLYGGYRWITSRFMIDMTAQEWQDYGWRIILIVIGIVLLLLFIFTVYVYYTQQANKRMRYFRIIPHIRTQTSPEAVTRLLQVFAHLERSPFLLLIRGPVWFRFLVYMSKTREIQLFVGCPEDKISGVKGAFRDVYPDAELFLIKDLPLPKRSKEGYGGRFRYASWKTVGLPFKYFRNSELGNLLSYMDKETWLDLQFSPTKYRKIQHQMDRAMKRIKMDKQELFAVAPIQEEKNVILNNLDPDVFNQRKSIYKRYMRRANVFRVNLYLWSEHKHADAVIQSLNSKINSLMQDQNSIRLRRYLVWRALRNRVQYSLPFPFQHSLLMTPEEVSNLFHLPIGSHPIYHDDGEKGYLVPLYEGQKMVNDQEFREGFPIGLLVHPVKQDRVMRIPYSTLTEMGFGSGKTGMGKSSFLLYGIFSYLEEEWYGNPSARGVTYVDAKGQDYKKIVAKLLKDEKEGKPVDWKRIHIFDFCNSRYIPGLNLLHRNPEEEIGIVVENALNVLKNAFPEKESIWLDRLGKLALLSLLESRGEHSILGLDQMIRQSLFRKRIILTLKDEWKQDWNEVKKDLENPQVSVPIFNRTQKIRYNQRLKRLFGQTHMDLDIKRWMDDGHLVLFNLAGLTDEERKMIMGFIITQYHQQSLKRSSTREHLHFVDEFSLVQIPIVAQILSLGRAFGHCFVAMMQYADQLDASLAKAFYGNVGTVIAVRQGFQSAAILKKMTGGELDEQSVQRLSRFQAAVHTVQSEGTPTTFFVKTKPIPLYRPNGQPAYFGADKDRQEREEKEAIKWVQGKVDELMARDCRPIEEVDQWIENYLQTDTIFQETEKQKEPEHENVEEEEEDDDWIFT